MPAATYKLPVLDGGNLIPSSKLGSGTPDGTKFLRDDQVWAVPSGGGGDIIARKTSNQSTTGQTLVECANLSFEVIAYAEYIIEYWLLFEPNAITVGIALAVDGPGNPSGLGIFSHVVTDVAAEQVRFSNQWNASGGATTSSASILNNVAIMHVIYKNDGTAGTFKLKFAAETSVGTISIRAGSIVKYRRTY